jgi:RNA polymerase sigma factor (sigma-70 family)
MEADAVAAYLKHSDEVVRFASAVVGPSSAEDVAAMVMSRVLYGTAWRSASNLRGYLFTAVTNEARSQHRATRRRWAREAADAGVAASDDSFVRAEVIEAVRGLSVRQRAVVYLTYWAGLASDEVAVELGISVRTVERELMTARRRLEVLLK